MDAPVCAVEGSVSSYWPNYCGPHGKGYADACPDCAQEWYVTLTKIEQALVLHVSQPGASVSGCKKLIEDFRKMEAA